MGKTLASLYLSKVITSIRQILLNNTVTDKKWFPWWSTWLTEYILTGWHFQHCAVVPISLIVWLCIGQIRCCDEIFLSLFILLDPWCINWQAFWKWKKKKQNKKISSPHSPRFGPNTALNSARHSATNNLKSIGIIYPVILVLQAIFLSDWASG